MNLSEWLAGVRTYDLRTRKGAVDEMKLRIDGLADPMHREEAQLLFRKLLARLERLDLSGTDWPPADLSPGVERLYAGGKGLVNAVIEIWHDRREVRVLKFVLKERP